MLYYNMYRYKQTVAETLGVFRAKTAPDKNCQSEKIG